MSVTPTFRTFVTEQLSRASVPIRTRAMFGGVGLYSGELFFALIDDDLLYFKVDDTNRPDFEARGMGPFRPAAEGGEVMQYYQMPEDLLEDVEMLGEWARKAIAVARRKKGRK